MINNQHEDVQMFKKYWNINPSEGLILELFDKQDLDIYPCTISKTNEDGIWVRRFNSEEEELVDFINLQLPAEEYELPEDLSLIADELGF